MPRPEPRSTLTLAAICVGLWALAAFGARFVGQWAALGGTAVVLATACVVIDGRSHLRLFGGLWPDTRRRWLVDIGAGLAGGAFMTAATYLLYTPVVHAAPLFFRDVGQLYGTFSSIPDWTATLILVPIIVGEELVWRGVVHTTLASRLSPVAAAACAALVYAAAHTPAGSPVLALAALGCGIVWSALRGLTGGLVAPLLAHLIWDFAVLLVHPLAAPVIKL